MKAEFRTYPNLLLQTIGNRGPGQDRHMKETPLHNTGIKAYRNAYFIAQPLDTKINEDFCIKAVFCLMLTQHSDNI